MKLEFIALDKLTVSTANMRHGRKDPDISDLLPTVRARGILQSLIVRPAPIADCFEILAGRRRYFAARAVAEETGVAEPVPCAILDPGDDAAALEASLIENLARLDPDEVSQWETFTRLIKEGRSVEEIGLTFGLPELTVKRVLALGNLLPRVRGLYAKSEIDAVTVRHLTMATKRQQQEWLGIWDDPDRYAPTGPGLKAWLFGGQTIPARHALFDVAASGFATVSDLFGEDAYFSDIAAFWEAQNAALDAKRDAYLADGWGQVVIVPPTEHFSAWDYEKTAKRKGGRVYLDVRGSGEVVAHEGYVSRREASRAAATEGRDATEKPKRPELTSTLQTYVDLHRHAAVRVALLGSPGVALRLMVAHLLAGTHLISAKPDPQTTRDEGTGESLANSFAEGVFGAARDHAKETLGISDPGKLLSRHADLTAIFLRLLDLSDEAVIDLIAVVMGEALSVGSIGVEAAGLHLGLDMADFWEADEAFLDLLRDKEVLVALVGDVAGETVARANNDEKGKALKTIIRNHLDGADGRPKAERWVPKWMAFPPAAYTARGGVATVAANAAVARAKAQALGADAGHTGSDDRTDPADQARIDREFGSVDFPEALVA